MGLFMDILVNGKAEEFEKSIKEAYSLGFRDGRLCPADLRPCEIRGKISGKQTLFHKWATEEDFLLKLDAFISAGETFAINRRVRETGVMPNIGSVTKISKVYAVIEWPDGSVTLEPAESVRFTDREEGDDAAD